jgi:hypothetical protein
MRMWMVDPKIMCRRHLLGEHVELHMFVGTINKGYHVKGYLANNCLEPGAITRRHDALVNEMRRRGYNHASELPDLIPSLLSDEEKSTCVDAEKSLGDLLDRCDECKNRYAMERNSVEKEK